MPKSKLKRLDVAKLGELFSQWFKENNAQELAKDGYRYLVETRAGSLIMRFESDRELPALFCRFVDPPRAVATMSYRVRLNEYSGKWNFHFADCSAEGCFESFLNEFKAVALPPPTPSRHDEAIMRLHRMYRDCLSLRSGAGQYTLSGHSSKGVATNLAGIIVPIDLIKALLGLEDDDA